MFLTQKIAAALLAFASSALATNYVTTAANGTPIPHPLDTTTYAVAAGNTTVNVPEGMVYVPAGISLSAPGRRRRRAMRMATASGNSK